MSVPTIYICQETFTAGNGRRFIKGETVSSFVINGLRPEDRKKFKVKEETTSNDSAGHSFATGPGSHDFGSSIGNNIGSDNYTSSNHTEKAVEDTPTFGGWGGGDTGGGGSSQDISSNSDSGGYSDSGGSSDGGGASGDY